MGASHPVPSHSCLGQERARLSSREAEGGGPLVLQLQSSPTLYFSSCHSWAQAPGESGIEDASQVRVRLPAFLCKQSPIDVGNQTEQVLPRPGFPKKGQASFVEFEGQSSFELVETSQF